jgi:hypothetical protein
MDGRAERMRERERKQHGTCTDIPRLEEHGAAAALCVHSLNFILSIHIDEPTLIY